MPRRRRIYVPGMGVHVIQRGNNRQPTFKDHQDKAVFARYMTEYLVEFDVQMHAFVLMTNHVHFYCSASDKWAVSRFMQGLCSRYTRYFNRRYQRTGTLWEGRYYSALADGKVHSLNIYRYIEQNPIKAMMVTRPGDFHWSSYAFNARGVPSDIITPHEDYLALGASDRERRSEYTRLCACSCSTEFLEEVRQATRTNGALGDEAFKQKLFELTGVRFGGKKEDGGG